MKVLFSDDALSDLEEIYDYIGPDSPETAARFTRTLVAKADDLAEMPYRCRQSIYHEESCFRDLVYRGYVLPFKIEEEAERIVILRVLKWRLAE